MAGSSSSSICTSTTRTCVTSTILPRRSRTATSWRSFPPWPEAEVADIDEELPEGAEVPEGAAVFPPIPPELGVHPLLLSVLHAVVFLSGSDDDIVNPAAAEEALE